MSKEKYVLILDASQLNQFGKCELSWAYAYRERLSKTGVASTAMNEGTLIHLILEIYYKVKLKYQLPLTEEVQKTIDIYKKRDEVISYSDPEAINFIINRFIEYCFFWQGRDLVPIEKNAVPAVELGFSKVLYEDNYCLYIVEGKIDMLNDMGQGITCFTDHKSQARTNHLYQFRPQMKTYAWATGLNHGMINYFGTQQKLTKDSLRRELIELPNWMLTQWEDHMLRVFTYIHNQDSEWNNNPNEYNENKFEKEFSSCSGSFDSNPCQFHDLCETQSKEMRDNLKSFKYEIKPEWKPWLESKEVQV